MSKLLRVVADERIQNTIKELSMLMNCENQSEVVRQSILIAYSLINNLRKDDKILIENKNGEKRQLIIPLNL